MFMILYLIVLKLSDRILENLDDVFYTFAFAASNGTGTSIIAAGSIHSVKWEIATTERNRTTTCI